MSVRPTSVPVTRCGTVAIVGKPNVGKSTLLNALIGESLAIVSDKPQATRVPVVGVRTDEDSQILFLDQPGILEPRYLMHHAMRETNIESVLEADAVLYVIAAGQEWESLDRAEPEFAALNKPVAHVVSKQDTGRGAVAGISEPSFMVSAVQRVGLDPLIAWCKANVPEGPFRYDVDEVSTQPARFFVAEYVREAAFNILSDEIPYAVAAEVDEFREGTTPLYIRVTIYVERPSQKRIVVGRGGATVREIGIVARRRVEEMMGQQVFLDLWVKVLPKWRTKPSALARFGLPLITGKET